MWQLVALGVLLLSLGGFWLANNHHQQEVGAERVRAEFAETELAKAKRTAELETKGRLELQRLLNERIARNRVKDQQLQRLASERQALSDALAKDDRGFALWRESRVPDAVIDRLREQSNAIVGSGSNNLPSGAGVSPGSRVTGAAESGDERRFMGIRIPTADDISRFLGRSGAGSR